MGTKYQIEVEVDESGHAEDAAQRLIHLELQKALTMNSFGIIAIQVQKKPERGATRRAPAGGVPGAARGRKPVNRPRIEDWIRKNIVAAPATMGSGNGGVDKEGKPTGKVPANRIILQVLATEVGLSMAAVMKVMGELAVEGYVERGYSQGSPYYELIKPLEEEGMVGIRGRADEDEEDDDEEDDEDELDD